MAELISRPVLDVSFVPAQKLPVLHDNDPPAEPLTPVLPVPEAVEVGHAEDPPLGDVVELLSVGPAEEVADDPSVGDAVELLSVGPAGAVDVGDAEGPLVGEAGALLPFELPEVLEVGDDIEFVDVILAPVPESPAVEGDAVELGISVGDAVGAAVVLVELVPMLDVPAVDEGATVLVAVVEGAVVELDVPVGAVELPVQPVGCPVSVLLEGGVVVVLLAGQEYVVGEPPKTIF